MATCTSALPWLFRLSLLTLAVPLCWRETNADELTPTPVNRSRWQIARQAQTPPVPAPPSATTPDLLKPIDEVVLPIPQTGKQPVPDYATQRFHQEPLERQGPGANREWTTTLYTWEAPALCHGPLYFEDENLERYGQSFGLVQPAVSAARFYGRAAALPYLMGAYPSRECYYTLGKGTPGTYIPYYLHRPPVSVRGALYQAGAVTGLSFFVP